MKCTILHDTAGRIRVHLEQPRMSLLQADILEAYLRNTPGVADVTVHDRTGNATILYTGQRAPIVAALAAFSYEKSAALAPEHSVRVLNREYEGKLIFRIVRRYTLKLILPAPLRAIRTVIRSLRFLRDGIRCLLHGKIEVPVLDATAIAVSILRGDFETAGSVIFLLGIGELLDEWTHKKSVADLAGTMALQVDKVWLETTDGSVAVPVGDVRPGDRIIVRTGGMIPLDGHVVAGEAMVNQASITGEGLAVRRTAGSYVYAGTVVEEGECTIRVDKSMGSGRYDRIVHMIEESEKLKSDTEAQASHLADRLVPYSLGATGLIWLLTRNVNRALAVLMVDFSCALKLSMPIAVLSGMKEAGIHHISVKGGRFMEAVAQADTIVFDKTGTLTHAAPRVAAVVPFGGKEENDMLALAACLEEHYPHSMAKAVVAEAEIVFANRVQAVLDYTDTVICCDIHTRQRSKRLLTAAGAKLVLGLDDLLTAPVNGSGYNPQYGLLGSNKADEERVKLFPRDAMPVAEAISRAMSEATGKRVEAMVYGDGAFKDPVGKIWELADPVVAPGYTGGLVGTPNELKLKYLADKEFAGLSGQALQDAISQKIREKDAKVSLVGNMVSEGTTPRNITDLIGSLCDLTSGSGDKGTPIIYIQGYFDNYTNE